MHKRRSHRNFEVRALHTPGMNPFNNSAETEGKKWAPTTWPTPGFIGPFTFDPIPHVLYVAKGMNGFWRLAEQRW
jgi:hypothetical protein